VSIYVSIESVFWARYSFFEKKPFHLLLGDYSDGLVILDSDKYCYLFF